MLQQGLFIGAYAAYSSLQPKTRTTERDFLRSLEATGFVRGLEIPFFEDIHHEDPESFLCMLPTQWEYIITALPGTMQALAIDPHYGLASANTESRKAALKPYRKLRERVAELHHICGRAVVRAVHIHTAPTRGVEGVRGDREALRRSLEELLSFDWSESKLIVEHCDAYLPGQTPRKGFLSLSDEIELLRELNLGLTINWARSAIEVRSASGVLEHVQRAIEAEVLQGLFFSGTSVDDPVYGHWQDNHAPIRLGHSQVWDPTHGLLGVAEVKAALCAVRAYKPVFLGLKVQAFPTHLLMAQRMECLQEQIHILADVSTTLGS